MTYCLLAEFTSIRQGESDDLDHTIIYGHPIWFRNHHVCGESIARPPVTSSQLDVTSTALRRIRFRRLYYDHQDSRLRSGGRLSSVELQLSELRRLATAANKRRSSNTVIARNEC